MFYTLNATLFWYTFQEHSKQNISLNNLTFVIAEGNLVF